MIFFLNLNKKKITLIKDLMKVPQIEGAEHLVEFA